MKSNPDELKEPDFTIDKDVLVISDKAHAMVDSTENLSLHASVILLSYNRPRMVREAVESVVTQSYRNLTLYVADDGSDFDWWEILDEFQDERIMVIEQPKIPVEKRLKRSRVGANINTIIETWIDPEDIIFYLCDDDIMAPHWIARSVQALENAPEYHIVQGNSWSFNDGQDWEKEAILGMPTEYQDDTPRLWWSTGSFCHRASCWHEEGLVWHDSEYGHSQDTLFIKDLWETHYQYLIIDKPAVFRREHKDMLSSRLGRKDDSGRYMAGFTPPPLEIDMLGGWMESEG